MPRPDPIEVVVAFGSLVLISFLGVLSVFRGKVYPVLAGALFLWLLVGLAAPRGETPVRPGAWPLGFLMGLPLLALARLYQKRRWSRRLGRLDDVIGLSGGELGLRAFVRHFVIAGGPEP